MTGFRPARGLTILTMVCVLFCSLVTWQVRRHRWRTADLAEKSARIELAAVELAEAEAKPDDYAFRRTEVRGRFELADTILVGPVERGHALGARVFTPLRREGAAEDAPRVLVDRGWIPQAETPRFMPSQSGESEVVTVRGLLLPLALREAVPGAREPRRTYFPRFSPDRSAKESLCRRTATTFEFFTAVAGARCVFAEINLVPLILPSDLITPSI